jgi:arylsulfatase A
MNTTPFSNLVSFLLLLILSACASPGSEESQSDQERLPNIVIILVDDMGYGDPACYNPDSKIPTPHINDIANEGMRFTDVHASGPLCHLSRYGLITGRYPFRTDVSVWRQQPTIEEDQLTVPKLLKTRGYHTAMVGKWHLGFQENGYENPLPGGPVDRGFDSYFGIRASTDIPPYFYIRGNQAVEPPADSISANASKGWSPIQGAFWRAGGIAPNLTLDNVLPRFTEEAIDVIENHSAPAADHGPLMLYLAYPAPHTPWLPSEVYKGKSGAGMYGDFLMMVDDQIGKVVNTLKKAGMYENTLLVFSSDNGPVWYDTDVDRFEHDSSGGLRGMKGDAWEAGHRMPFLVRWPGKVQAGSVSNLLVGFTDVLATVAEITDAPPDGIPDDSHSFLPVLTGAVAADDSGRPPLVLRSASGAMVIRSGNWKLIDRLGSGGFSRPSTVEPASGDPQGQLYHMVEDSGETNNLYLEQPEVVARLQAEMQEIVEASISAE